MRQIFRRDLPGRVRLMAGVKDEAYGHDALDVARIALEEGAWGFGPGTLEEATGLRDARITAPLLLPGERQEADKTFAKLKNSVTYDVLASWRLRRKCVNGGKQNQTRIVPVNITLSPLPSSAELF